MGTAKTLKYGFALRVNSVELALKYILGIIKNLIIRHPLTININVLVLNQKVSLKLKSWYSIKLYLTSKS